MNILPKKSWHVRTKANIERVRRDEAKAAEEEKELKRRIRLAEQEARTELLRKKAKSESSSKNSDGESTLNKLDAESSTKKSVAESSTKNSDAFEHINFFKEIEDAGGYGGSFNKEHEEEEKARKEKFEKDIGLLTYLGQSSLESKGETPWYLKSSSALLSSDGKEDTPSLKHKSRIDPLIEMNKYLSIKQSGGKEIYIHEKVKPSSSLRKNESPSKKLSKIEELRAKRLRREAEEKRKSQKFLENLSKGSSAAADEVILDDRARKYNTQFNPHLARNNLHTREY